MPRQDAELTRNRGYSAHSSDDGLGIGKVSATAEVRGSGGGERKKMSEARRSRLAFAETAFFHPFTQVFASIFDAPKETVGFL